MKGNTVFSWPVLLYLQPLLCVCDGNEQKGKNHGWQHHGPLSYVPQIIETDGWISLRSQPLLLFIMGPDPLSFTITVITINFYILSAAEMSLSSATNILAFPVLHILEHCQTRKH